MIDPLAAFSLPRQRLSMQALVTVGVLHVALLWLMLQNGPAVQATRQVVMQYFSPITPLRDKPKPAPMQAATPVPRPVAVVTSLPPRVEAVTPPAELTPAPIIRTMEAQTQERVTVKMQDIKAQPDLRRVPEMPATRSEPLLAPVPELPTPEPLPVPELPKVPVLPPVAPPVQTPPTPAPAPDPVAPAAAVPPAALAAPARAAAITPVEGHSAPTNAAGGSGSASPQITLPATAGQTSGSGLNLNYNYRADRRSRQKSASEMANEQLNGGGHRDKLADGVKAAEKPDCINSGQALGLLAPIAIAYNVANDKCR